MLDIVIVVVGTYVEILDMSYRSCLMILVMVDTYVTLVRTYPTNVVLIGYDTFVVVISMVIDPGSITETFVYEISVNFSESKSMRIYAN